MFEKIIEDYVADLIVALKSLNKSQIKELSIAIKGAIDSDKKIFMMGNGGSSAPPSHSAGDYSKELGARTICLSDNISVLTALANDTDYSNVFKGQLEVYMDPGDIVIGYSGSGNSPNVINAIEYANKEGVFTVGVTGNYKGLGPGKIADISDLCIIFETESMEVIEDMENILNHIVKLAIKLSAI